jgi:hypothetical protein
MKKEHPLRLVAFKLVVLYWLVLACMALFISCSTPKQRRGDWMEHLNDKQFRFNAPTVAWDRRKYYSLDELKEIWAITYEKAIADLDTE